MSSYEYVRRAYRVAPEVGARVRHNETGRAGTIAREDRSQSHYVQVRFDGDKHALPCHPIALDYVLERYSPAIALAEDRA